MSARLHTHQWSTDLGSQEIKLGLVEQSQASTPVLWPLPDIGSRTLCFHRPRTWGMPQEYRQKFRDTFAHCPLISDRWTHFWHALFRMHHQVLGFFDPEYSKVSMTDQGLEENPSAFLKGLREVLIKYTLPYLPTSWRDKKFCSTSLLINLRY